MITEYGTIVELKNNGVALVLCQRNSACEHCPSSGACQMGTDGESMQVEATNMIDAKVGDRVKIVTSTKHFLQSSFMLYIVPIIGLLIGALIGQTIGEHTDVKVDPSLLSAILGVAFLVGTFLCIKVGTQALEREMYRPRIASVENTGDVS